jgi:hypothetical protein
MREEKVESFRERSAEESIGISRKKQEAEKLRFKAIQICIRCQTRM